MQTLVVGWIVFMCAVYAGWSLAPSALRRSIATSMLRVTLPARWTAFFTKHASAASGCGCDGCDRGAKGAKPSSSASSSKASASAPAVQPITFHRRPNSNLKPRSGR